MEEMFAKLKEAKSVEEIVAVAKEYGKGVTLEAVRLLRGKGMSERPGTHFVKVRFDRENVRASALNSSGGRDKIY